MSVLGQDWAAKWALYSPEKIAFKEFNTQRAISFAELNERANALAHHLKQQFQIEKGNRIAILAENALEHLLLFSVAQKTGAILVPLNYRLKAAELDYMLSDSSPSLLIVEDKFEAEIKQAPHYQSIPHKWPLAKVMDIDGTYSPTLSIPPLPLVDLAENDPILILYTSGTTGFPKGAIYSHKMLFWNSVNTSMTLLINTESRTVNCMPFFHTGGWNVLTTPFLHHGGYSCLMPSFDASETLRLLSEEKATVFMGVPTMLKMMAEESNFDSIDLSSLKYIIVGGEPMPIPLIEKWHEKGVPIRQGYGMTEVGPNLTSLHQKDAFHKKGSIGRPNFYVQHKIVGAHGKEVSPGQAGELLLKGPMVTPGYWQNPQATEKSIKEGWFHTGDMAKEDEDNYLYIVDRIKNMFISGGENVYPAEVERTLIQHKAVNEVAVIGIPHAKWGEVGCAFVVLQIPIPPEQILDFCKQRLAKFKVPKEIIFVDHIPKNNTGKIDRKKIKTWI